MRRAEQLFIALTLFLFCADFSGGQSLKASDNKTISPDYPRLVISERVKVASELAGIFVSPLKCDGDGNLYLKSDTDRVTAVRKFDPKGKRLALFLASSALDLPTPASVTTYYAVKNDGAVYQLAFLPKTLDRYVLVYNSDGTYKSNIKLQPGFPWKPSQLAVFPSGTLMVAGERYGAGGGPDRPFTGLFSEDGSLLKTVELKDDEMIEKMAASGDRRVVPEDNPSLNFAIERGALEIGPDGNVYLMRRLSTAVVYAISTGGAVLRRFTVDPGDANYIPITMNVAKSGIAVLFRQPQTGEGIMKVVDLAGHELATYRAPASDGDQTLGSAFACYSDNPERFTFLTTTEDEHLGFKIAEPR